MFKVEYEKAMNIDPKLQSEKELARFNKLRETSLINFYRTGVKSLFSFICHNVNMVWLSTWGSESLCRTARTLQLGWRTRTCGKWWEKELVWLVWLISSMRWPASACVITANSYTKTICSSLANSLLTNRPSLRWTLTLHVIQTLQKCSNKVCTFWCRTQQKPDLAAFHDPQKELSHKLCQNT